MSFLNPFFLFGIATVAAPILVHLVRRTRARRVEFPALVFVRQVPQRTIRRRALHNLLLLLLRCLVVLLIVFAFTRPFFKGRTAPKNSSGAGATLILLDTSLSMRREGLFKEARHRAETVINEASASESLALVDFGKRYELVSRFSNDRGAIRSTLGTLNAGWEGTDYEQALRGAESIIAEQKVSGPKRIILISDFQTPGWNAANATFKLSNDIQLVTQDVGGNNPPGNIALTNLEGRAVIFGQKYADNLAVTVTNYSETPRDHLQINFQIDDQTVEKREVSLNSRDSRVIEFTNFNLNEGSNRCTMEIGGDEFAADNRFYFTLHRETPAKALIIESASRGRGDSFYLESALTTNDSLPFSFTIKSTGFVDPARIGEYSLVILNDAGQLSGVLADNLTKFVNAGGQLIVAAGPHTEANSFNSSLRNISPAELRELVQTRAGEGAGMSEVKFEHPIFEVFQQSGRLASAHVNGYFRSEARPSASVLARFEDGSPALLESRVGKGRVLLFTSTLGPAWNDLPLTPLYLPFVHQMVRYTGEREASPWYGLGQSFTVKKDHQGTLPAVDSPSGVRLSDSQLTQEGDVLLTAREPGFYRLRYEKAPDFAAVDIDGAEGDFTKLNFAEFMAGITGGSGSSDTVASTRKSSNEEIESRQRVWWPLLLIALLLLLTESLLARRTKMVKMIG